MARFIAIIFSVCLIWFIGVKPFLGEVYYFKYRLTQKEQYIHKAIKFDPESSLYQLTLAKLYFIKGKLFKAQSHLDRAIYNHNGDLLPWATWYMNGIHQLRMNNVIAGLGSFHKSLEYNPMYRPAQNAVEQLSLAMARTQRKK